MVTVQLWRHPNDDQSTSDRVVMFDVCCNAGRACGTNATLAAPSTCKPSPSCPQVVADQQALTAWKANVSDPRGQLATWLGPNPCSRSQPWAAVNCSDDGLAVVGLNVSGFGLQGPVPPAGNMTMLKVIPRPKSLSVQE